MTERRRDRDRGRDREGRNQRPRRMRGRDRADRGARRRDQRGRRPRFRPRPQPPREPAEAAFAARRAPAAARRADDGEGGFNVAGLPTTWGFAQHRDFIATEDAVAVQRLKAAGAIILGKTNVPVGLADWQATTRSTAAPTIRYDPARSPGGSSGGARRRWRRAWCRSRWAPTSAARSASPPRSAASGATSRPMARSTPTATISRAPTAMRRSMAVIGPLARDARRSGAGARSPRRPAIGARPKRARRENGASCLWRRHPFAAIAAPVAEAVERTGAAFEAAGARVDRSSDLLPDLSAQFGHYMPLLMTALARGVPMDGSEPPSLARLVRPARPPGARRARLEPAVRALRRGDRAGARHHRIPA